MKKQNPDLQVDPLAELFPMLEGAERELLKTDIRSNRLRDAIMLRAGKILDGRNRYRAIRELDPKFSPRRDPGAFVEFQGSADQALAYVLSKNLARRHLTEGQRAMIAARIAQLGVGRPGRQGNSANLQNLSQGAAAGLLKISTRSVASAKVVRDQGAPELQREVEQGRVAVSTAEQLATRPADEQAEIVAKGPAEILKAAKAIMADRRNVRRVERFARIAETSKANEPLPTGKKYPVIYADPPWRFESGFSDRSIENHYATMTWQEICALPIKQLAADVAVLFLMVTVPMLLARGTWIEDGREVTGAILDHLLQLWGFDYKSSAVWDKIDPGTGYWFFNQHEILVVATRGSFPAPDPVVKARSVYPEKKTAHSAKPEYYRELIERYTPGLPRIELFARTPRAGWDLWGNQSKRPIFLGMDLAKDGDKTVAMEWRDGVLTPCDLPEFLPDQKGAAQ